MFQTFDKEITLSERQVTDENIREDFIYRKFESQQNQING